MTDEQIDEWISTIATYDLAGPRLNGRERIHRFARAILAASSPVAVSPVAQNPKFTQDEWIAHARKHGWRFDLPHEELGVSAQRSAPVAPAEAVRLTEVPPLKHSAVLEEFVNLWTNLHPGAMVSSDESNVIAPAKAEFDWVLYRAAIVTAYYAKWDTALESTAKPPAGERT